jgi:hypothetical protein
MVFRTLAECKERARLQGFKKEDFESEDPFCSPFSTSIRLYTDQPTSPSVVLARHLVSWLGPFRNTLLWVNEYGIWPSSENNHLYYRLRQSYGDQRKLQEAPGHEFVAEEVADLTSFLDLTIQFGWGAHLLSIPAAAYIFISHDEWILVQSDSQKSRIIRDLESLACRFKVE